VFFSEEKNQKTFGTLSRLYQAAPTPEFAKVFCFFSSEKKTFLPGNPPAPRAGVTCGLGGWLVGRRRALLAGIHG
jgi:hypothetical protein